MPKIECGGRSSLSLERRWIMLAAFVAAKKAFEVGLGLWLLYYPTNTRRWKSQCGVEFDRCDRMPDEIMCGRVTALDNVARPDRVTMVTMRVIYDRNHPYVNHTA